MHSLPNCICVLSHPAGYSSTRAGVFGCHVFSAAQSSRIFLDPQWGDVTSTLQLRFYPAKHPAMCRGVIFCPCKAAQGSITLSRCHVLSAAQSSRIFLGHRRLTIIAHDYGTIANRIAKSWKAVPNLLKPSGKKIFNLMKYPDPAGIT